MDLGIAGRRAAVAASSAGLGFSAARALVDAGCHVAICGRNPARLEDAAAQLGELAIPIVGDVGTVDGGTAFIEQAREMLGGIDVLIANSSGPPTGNVASTPIEAYRDALESNLLSTISMCRAAVPDMQASGFGRVVAITSITVRQPIEFLVLSNTARAGVTGFLKTLALEVAGDGVTVNSVQPGYHATDRLADVPPAVLRETVDAIPVGRLGDPDDFGRTVAFLCSTSASFITGTAVPVDGGTYGGLL